MAVPARSILDYPWFDVGGVFAHDDVASGIRSSAANSGSLAVAPPTAASASSAPSAVAASGSATAQACQLSATTVWSASRAAKRRERRSLPRCGYAAATALDRCALIDCLVDRCHMITKQLPYAAAHWATKIARPRTTVAAGIPVRESLEFRHAIVRPSTWRVRTAL